GLNVLVIGDKSVKNLLCAHLGYDPDGVKVVPTDLGAAKLSSLARRSVARSIFAPAHYPNEDELNDLLAALNRVLEMDGVFLIAGSQAWPAAGSKLRMSIGTKLQQAGFRLISYMASPQDLSFALDLAPAKAGVAEATYYYPCWLATKISEFVETPRRAEVGA